MKLIIIVLLLLPTLLLGQFFTWEPGGEMKRPVAGGEIWENEDMMTMYILGGYSDSLQANVHWIQTFNNEWHIDSMSTPRFGFVADNYKSQAIFFGGVSNDINSTSGIEKWGPNFTDEAIFSTNSIFNRIFSTGHIIGDNLYIIGGNPLPGTSSDTLAYITEYNLNQSLVTHKIDSVFSVDELPEQQFSEVLGDDIFIFGGIINGISQDIYKFNPFSKSFKKLPIKLLEPRAGGRAIRSVTENKIYIIGGYNESLEALNSVEIFHVFGENYEIYEGPPILHARYNFMSGKRDGKIYILGGFDTNGNVIGSIEKLDDEAVTQIQGTNSNNIYNEFKLFQNYPNPFNPTSTINYEIPQSINSLEAIKVQIIIYDLLGNQVEILVDKKQNPGHHSVVIDVTQFRNQIPSGVYFYQLKTNSFVQTKKMLLLK